MITVFFHFFHRHLEGANKIHDNQVIQQFNGKDYDQNDNIQNILPEEDFAKSSATKEVATLRSGMLNSFEMILKIDIETPADASCTGPAHIMKTK